MKTILSKIRRQFKTGNEDSFIISSLCNAYCKKDGNILLFKKKENYNYLDEQVKEKYCSIFKHTLTGQIGTKLFSMPFNKKSNKIEYFNKMLHNDDSIVDDFINKILDNYEYDTDILVSLVRFSVKNPYISNKKKSKKDNEDLLVEDTIYLNFVMGCINPVGASAKNLLVDIKTENKEGFMSVQRESAGVVSEKTERGFLYPSIDEDGQVADKILYFTSKKDCVSTKFVENILCCDKILTNSQEVEMFNKILLDAFGETVDTKEIYKVYKDIESYKTPDIKGKDGKNIKTDTKSTINIKQLEKVFIKNGIDCKGKIEKLVDSNLKALDKKGILNNKFEFDIKTIVPNNPKDLVITDKNITIHLGSDNLDKILEVKNIQDKKCLLIQLDNTASLNKLKIKAQANTGIL